jgi:LPS O-antigen subunit length determinant protein (WzzB/FepE family)
MKEHNGFAIDQTSGNKVEIDILDIFGFIKYHFFILILFIFIGGAAASVIYASLPKKWESEVTLQIGKVPVLNTLEYMDVPAALVEKIKSPEFLSRVLKEIYGNQIDRSSPTAELFYHDLSVSPVRESSLITLRVFGWSPEEAYKNADIVGNTIVKESLANTAQYFKNAEAQLNEVSAEIRLNEGRLNKASEMEQDATKKNDASTLMKLALSDGIVSRIQMLQKEKARLENLISASQFQEMRVVAKSLPPLSPSSPRLGLLIIGGALLGLFLGVLLALFLQRRAHRIDGGRSAPVRG